eukprot:11026423-Alexandrium_andersonii.AAC.1
MLDAPEGPVEPRHPSADRTGSGQVGRERCEREDVCRRSPVPVGVGPGEVGKGRDLCSPGPVDALDQTRTSP